jgi:Ca2+-binding RTX toxin-like protein
MLRACFQAMLRGCHRRSARRHSLPARFLPTFEGLETRLTPAITASFSAQAGVLTVLGDGLDNTITVSRNAGGTILVNNGAVAVLGGTPTVANTAQVSMFGLGGNDRLEMNETNGALPRAVLQGGSGSDILIGGSGADMLFGQSGNDNLQSRGGIDFLFGGENDDVLTGGDADDQAFGQSGNDRMIWNPGDDTDLNEGGSGSDTVEVNGGGGAEAFTVTANGARVRFDRINPAPFALDIGTSENLVLNANGGDDTFSATGNLAALIRLTIDGGTGNDSLLGSNGPDTLISGDGNDFVDGQQGDDVGLLGAGNDVFQWDPGDGSDVVEGQAGSDTLLFNGSGGNEIITVSANGARARFTRDLGNITMDLDDVEGIDFNALGGTDTITVNDLSGTDVTTVNLNLAGTLGGTTGDALADTVIVNGTNNGDVIHVTGNQGGASVLGLAARVNITNAEPANDRLTINALGGDDVVDAAGLAAVAIRLAADGGDGDDVLIGSAGNDTFSGGAGDDVLIGGPGLDVLDGGLGDNVVIQS